VTRSKEIPPLLQVHVTPANNHTSLHSSLLFMNNAG
jgi:hypothetical protein